MAPNLPEDGPTLPAADAVEILAAQFLAQLQAGDNPDRQAVVRSHPELGSRLERRLAHIEMVFRVGLTPSEAMSHDSESMDALTALRDLDPRDAPTKSVDGPTALASIQPADLANYEILVELGRGGMGVVYKARQKSLNRIVALKMIAAGAHASPELRARFHIEAEALASLQHPHILQVYEVGEHDGCPFMAMEFLDGGTLGNYLRGRPQAPDVAAALVETLARAAHAAHQRGIVHRDLKPANILLASEERRARSQEPEADSGSPLLSPGSRLLPKITDFGLAKRLAADKGGTLTGAILGTPCYMAPEQAGGRVHETGPPADIYALGAILYEMLTGRPPFHGESALAILDQVVSTEPAPPSRLCRRLPRDLETICLKCLEKVPARRYATAADLADDLRRFLDGKPIVARPVGLAERAWKWVKRRPALAILGAVVCAALFALAIGGITWSVQVRAERDRTRHSLQVARKAIDDLYTKMASERLFDEPQLDPLCQELFEKARGLYEELAAEHSDHPEVRRDVALAWFRLGDIHRLREQYRRAEEAYTNAIARQENLRNEYPREPDYRQDLANSHNWLGELLRERHRPQEAEHHFRAAMALQEKLAENDPEQRAYRMELARSAYNLGIVQKETSRLSDARAAYDRAVQLLTALHKTNPAEANVRQDLARALINRGVLHRLRRQAEDAGRDYDQAIALLARLRAEFPARAAYKFEMAIAAQNRGNLLWSLRRHAEAVRAQQEALTLLRGLVADFSSRPRYRKKMGNALLNLGTALASAQNSAGAQQCWDQARSLFAGLIKASPENVDAQMLLGMTLANLSWLQTEKKDWARARQLLDRAIVHVQAAVKVNPHHPDYQQELRNLYQDQAETLVQLRDHAAAVQAATNLAGVFPKRAQDSYYAACFIARCVPLLAKDDRLAPQYISQALTFLRNAADHATPQLQRLPSERQVFQPLAAHADFDAVMRALNAKSRAAKGQG